MAKMTDMEKELFRQAVIKEYKLKQEVEKENSRLYRTFVKRFRKIAPYNLVIGIVASVLLVIIKGWDTLLYLLLSGIVWITLVSTVLSTILKPE